MMCRDNELDVAQPLEINCRGLYKFTWGSTMDTVSIVLKISSLPHRGSFPLGLVSTTVSLLISESTMGNCISHTHALDIENLAEARIKSNRLSTGRGLEEALQ